MHKPLSVSIMIHPKLNYSPRHTNSKLGVIDYKLRQAKMSFAQRESAVLAALLLVVAALIPSFIPTNEPKVVIQADSSSSAPQSPQFQFQWHWITTTLSILATPLQIIL